LKYNHALFLQSCEGLKGGGGTDIQRFKKFMFNIAYQTFNFESNIAFLHLSPICWFSKMMKWTYKCSNRINLFHNKHINDHAQKTLR